MNKKPEYLIIYETIRKEIEEGLYRYGAKLPSKRTLADRFNVSVITIEHSYQLLSEEGYIQPRQRSGYFCIYRNDLSFPVGVGGNESRPHAVFEDYGQFPVSTYIKTIRKVLTDYDDAILTRSPNFGTVELKSAVSDYLERSRGIKASAGQIIIGSGAEYLYGLIIQTLGKDAVYGIEDPSYEKIEQVYKAWNADYEMLKLGEKGIGSETLAGTGARILHITPYRSYPTGATADISKKYEYLNWAQTDDRILIEDDFESEFSMSVRPVDTLYSLSSSDNVIYINTFSKTISASIRIGYMVIPESMIKLFQEKVGFYSCTVPSLDQYILAEFMNSGAFERYLNRVRRERRKSLKQ